MGPHESFCRWLEGYLEAHKEHGESVSEDTVLKRLTAVLNPPISKDVPRGLNTEELMRELRTQKEALTQKQMMPIQQMTGIFDQLKANR